MTPVGLTLLTVAVAMVFFVVETRSEAIGLPRRALDGFNAPERYHWVAFASLFAISALVMLAGQSFAAGFLDTAIAASLAWAALSILWAEDRRLTARRAANWLLVAASAFALSSRLSLPQCAIVIAGSCGVFLLIAMLEELAAGMFRLEREYRFPTGGATKQSEHSVLLAFSATYLYHVGYLGNAATVLLVGTAFVLLFLTRTLNSFWPAVGAAVLWFALQSDALQGSAWLTGGVGCLVVLGLLCLGSSRWRDRLVGVLFLGREFSNWLTLSSRTPIWSYALRSVPARPVLGFGYGGFWNSHRSGEAAQSFGWTNPVSTSCSLYVEALVNTGVIGLALFMSVFIAGYAAAFRLPMAECGFMLAVMTYVTLHSGFNTTFALPSFRAFALFLLLFGM